MAAGFLRLSDSDSLLTRSFKATESLQAPSLCTGQHGVGEWRVGGESQAHPSLAKRMTLELRRFLEAVPKEEQQVLVELCCCPLAGWL